MREALRDAMAEEMRRDETVFLMGEDVGAYGGCYAVSKGLMDEFGEDRIRDTPLSESGFVGAAILWNLNFGPTLGADFAESSYSLLRPDSTKRPVYEALAAVPKG